MRRARRAAPRPPRNTRRYVAHLVADDAHVRYEANRADYPLVIDDQLAYLLADLHARAFLQSGAGAQQLHRLDQIGIRRFGAAFAVGCIPTSQSGSAIRKIVANSPHSVAGRVYALNVFSNKFVFKTLELTTVDLLRKVERPSPKLTEPEVLDIDEHQLLLESYDRDTFEDVRDRAFLCVLAATGLRLSAVRTMRLDDYDRVTGEFKVHENGDEDRPAVVDGRARCYLNQYLARRPRTSTAEQLWVTEAGAPLSYWGAFSVMRRAKKRSGIQRVHAHLFRHGIAHRAADQGAHPGEIQLLLGTRAQRWPGVTQARGRSARVRDSCRNTRRSKCFPLGIA